MMTVEQIKKEIDRLDKEINQYYTKIFSLQANKTIFEQVLGSDNAIIIGGAKGGTPL